MFVDRYTDNEGNLFVKYFLIDSSLNDRKWATTDEANERYARTAIGTPFTVMHDKKESLFGDYHPFLKGDAPVKEQIDFAYKYAIGQIVDVTKDSGQYKAAGGPVMDKPWFAIVKITDPTAKEELSKPDTKLIPEAVSPGIIHYDGPDNAISSYHIVHLAAVDRGAYGPRAVKVASCNGDALSCVPELKSAAKITNKQDFSSLEYYNRHLLNVSGGELVNDPTVYVPVLWRANLGASSCDVCERLDGSVFDSVDANRHFPAHDHCKCELVEEVTEEDLLGASYISPKIRKRRKKAASYKERNQICPLQVLSSYAQKSGSSDIIMSAVSNASTPAPQTFGTGTISTSYPDQQQQSSQAAKPTIRIRKKPLALAYGQESEENGQQAEQPEGNNGEQEQTQTLENPQASVASVTKELAQLKKQYESQANVWKQDSMRRELQDAIPKSLFTDQKGRFREKDWQREVDARLQQGLPIETIREIYQLKVQMLEVPEIAIKSKRASSLSLPKGASSQYDAEDEEKRMKLAELGRMIRGQY